MKNKHGFSKILNIILIIIILMLLGGLILTLRNNHKLKTGNEQLISSYENQLKAFASIPQKKDTISDVRLEQELRNRNLFVFQDYKGRGFKHLNTAYKYVVNKKNSMIHKSHYPGGSAAYAIGLDNREYSNDLDKYPKSKYPYCTYCFPELLKSSKSKETPAEAE